MMKNIPGYYKPDNKVMIGMSFEPIFTVLLFFSLIGESQH